jgi:two-component sensor histidine kinase
MLAYGSDRTQSPPDLLADSPDEIRALHAVYLTLVRTIEEDEANLQRLLVEKDMLLREVNHRSGNNLQTIASAMRLYRSHTEDPKLRMVLDGLITRVIALASTNIALFSQAGREDVPIDMVLLDVIRRLKEIHTIPIGTARKALDPIRMPAEIATPLALALAEAVNSFFASPGWTGEGIAVALFRQGDEVLLRISGPVIPELSGEKVKGLDALPRLMLGHFAAQMQARLTIGVEAGQSTVELAIPQRTGGAPEQS